jgi:hypothetical protein
MFTLQGQDAVIAPSRRPPLAQWTVEVYLGYGMVHTEDPPVEQTHQIDKYCLD